MARKPPPGKSLAEVNPELAKEWHPKKNEILTPYDVTINSREKVWWKCGKCIDHEWKSVIYSRSNGNGCPVCSGQKVVLSNCLATLNPLLAKQWHPKNGELTPFDVTIGANKKVWWKCEKGDDHEWISSVANRSNGTGCPICSGKKVVLSNCLATVNPELAKEWHPLNNDELTPNDVSEGSNKKVWWKCNKGDDHEWRVGVNDRSRGNSCPICAGYKVVNSNCLATLRPELAKDWHPTKNGSLTPNDVTVSSHKKVWWKCSKGNDHEWKGSIKNRTSGRKCPVCRGLKVVISNSLAATHPILSKELHRTKNGKLNPQNLHAQSQKRIWWKCSKGDDHVWNTILSQRTRFNTGCPYCDGQRIGKSNSLATLDKELSKQWHPTKNGNLTPHNIGAGDATPVWWVCKTCLSEWKSTTNNRSKGKGCPYCTLAPQSKQELSITFELITIFKDINPIGFKTRVNGKLWTIDIYISELSLGIEFDGSYWHKNKRELDKLKTEKLKSEGFEIMRIRQEPLKVITDIDVVSKNPFNAKDVTNDVLKRILGAYSLDKKRVKKIEKYLLKKTIQNEKGLDDYIEMILTMKAEKKNNHS